MSPALAGEFFTTEPQGKPQLVVITCPSFLTLSPPIDCHLSPFYSSRYPWALVRFGADTDTHIYIGINDHTE